jgi:glycogen debranching enzyme
MNALVESSASGITMEEAAGYGGIACESQVPVEHALVLKHDDYFFISNSHGDIAPAGSCSLGLFENDTRILSHYALSFHGGPPALLSVQSPHSYLGQIDLAITDEEFGGNRWDPKNCIHLQREFLLADRLIEQLTLTNYLPRPISYWIELAVACDFADIFEVRGWKRERRGQFFAPEPGADRLGFSYRGVDGAMIESFIRFHQAPAEIHSKGARWHFDLLPNTKYRLGWEVHGSQAEARHGVWSGFGFEESRKRRDEEHARWTAECARFSTTPREFEGLLERAADDLNALHSPMDGGRVICAGIPWYSTIFGRDAIITSLETLILNPQIARETLRYLARYQGRNEDAFTEEEPGKIMHELRRGEMARNREIPHVPYYGTIDATPLWLILLHETWQWTNDTQLVIELLPNAARALDWIDAHGDKDGDGFVEYLGSATSKGLANQGWKDSGDGVPFPDATLPEPPIALVEVQGYVYDAFVRMADLYAAFGEAPRAEALRGKAAALRENIVRHFWIEELGIFALALDGNKRPLPTIASNAGHLLWSGVPDPQQAQQLAKNLLGAEMHSGWGIRTLSAAHRAFNPMSYHNGSVWPHDNALIAMGLARYGFGKAALTVLHGLHDAAACDEFQRLPELFCGMPRSEGTHPVWYPVSCAPQAWAAGAFFMLLQGVLGIRPNAPAGTLQIQNPALPDFVHDMTISGLKIGGSEISLQFERRSGRTSASLLSLSGDPLRVGIELVSS